MKQLSNYRNQKNIINTWQIKKIPIRSTIHESTIRMFPRLYSVMIVMRIKKINELLIVGDRYICIVQTFLSQVFFQVCLLNYYLFAQDLFQLFMSWQRGIFNYFFNYKFNLFIFFKLMGFIYNIPLLTLLIIGIKGLTIQILQPKTCLKLQAEYENDQILINFHQNLNAGSCSLKIYSPSGALIADSGYGHQYRHYLEVLLPSKGEYDMCFEKKETQNLQVSFQILREEEKLNYAGKQDLGRITRRVGDFLVEIKKTSWEYKQLLAQHNKWGDKFRDYQTFNYTLYGLKLALMVCVLSVQIWIVKKVFE